MALEAVFNCRDVTELILCRLVLSDLLSLRATSTLLNSAIDEWAIDRLVVCDGNDHRLARLTPERFPNVRSLILRAVSPCTVRVLCDFAATGLLEDLEYDGCDLGEVEVISLIDSCGRTPVKRLAVRDVVFETQQALEGLCGAHPAEVVQIEGVRLKVVGKELMIIGNDEQQFLARLAASRTQCVIPSCVATTPKTPFTLSSLSFTHNIHLTPQRPLWKTPQALWGFQETLERLDLSGNALAHENMELLFFEGHFKRLEKLRLRDCGLTESHMEIMSQVSSMVRLKHLDLSRNRLGTPIALYYLASSAQLTTNLEYLSVADQEQTTDDWLYGLALTTSRWQLKTLNASKSSNVSATSMLGICESMPRLCRLLIRTSYVTKDALSLFGRSDLFTTIEEVDFSAQGASREGGVETSRGVEARRVEDCFCVRKAERLRVLKLRASATRQSRKYDRKALKALKATHGTHVVYVIDDG